MRRRVNIRRRQASSFRTLVLTAAVIAAAASSSRTALTYAAGEIQDGQVIDLPAGGNLQSAISTIQAGGTIRLQAGATYAVNNSFRLPIKSGASFVTITTRDAVLPPPGTRIDPSYKPRLAIIKSLSTSPAVVALAGSGYYRFVGVAFEGNVNGEGDIIQIGHSSYTSVDQLPHHIELDRVLITGSQTIGQKRAVAVNGRHIVIENSDIREIKYAGLDSQAIAAWNTTGPITIRNNYLSAAGENIMFGGSDASIPGATPSDIVIENNLITKELDWRGSKWTVKNLFELKHAKRVTVRRNTMTYNWAAAQVGYAIVLTPRNQDGGNPWATIEDVEISGNVISHTGGAFNLLGHDDIKPSQQMRRITIQNNLVYAVDHSAWGGNGTFAQIGAEPRDITFDHNTIFHSGKILAFYSGRFTNQNGVRVSGGPISGFVFTNNLVRHNEYGIFGDNQASGNNTLATYTTGALVQRNVIATNTSKASTYPADNQFPTLATFNGSFVNAASHDYRLTASSPYVSAGLDGKNLGVDFAALLVTTPPAPPTQVRVTRDE